MATISERLKKVIVEQLGVEESEVTPEASFAEDLNAGPLDLVELIMAVEEEFSTTGMRLEIRGEDAEKIKTVQQAIDYLYDHGIDGLFIWPVDQPRLIAGLRKGCSAYFFPKFSEFHKPGCLQGPAEEVLLSRRGKLTSYTIQYFPVPSPFVNPEPLVPFILGIVALPEGMEVAGQLTGVSVEDARTT